ncbi:ubiquitin-associated protein 2-like isoform X10 [Passer domesticus]|uniref:ubiquitin-associated protein 2-like isoform X10 n=1 Tax=Passer domesticus TaxID=48849 RepID=UPI0030FE6AB8
MMTSVVSERPRGTRDKMQISTSQPTQPQKQVVQATAEQIRLAQMIYDKNDTDFEDKVKQLMEVTGKNQDECIVALHDCNGDMNRAINILLEGSSDTTSWETVGGKKKNLGKECLENKENREKRGDREMSRGWGSSNRRGRGGSRGREFRAEENGVENSQEDRPSDRGKRSCGRGFGRGRGRGAGRFSTQGMGTFNPADYMESSATDGFGTKSEIWETGQNDADDGTGAWKNSVEEWTAEDWNEDLSETKVFTASSVPAENHVTPRQSIDLVTLLQKPEKPVTLTQETEGNSFEAPQQQTFGQALVFTNSQHSTQMASGTGSFSAVNSYSPQSLSAVLCPGFREHGSPKLTNSTGSQILDQLKSPGLGQFTSQQNNNSSTTTTTSSWDQNPPITQASALSQFDLKSQPQPSPVLIHLTQRQQQQTQAAPVPPLGLESFSQVKLHEPLPVDTSPAVSKMLQLPTISMDNQEVTAHQMQQKQIKPPKRRITPSSKIPASAVEMPGSADVTGLNVQFGALEFGSEPTLIELGSTSSSENTSQATNNSLYSKSVKYVDPLNTSLPISNTVQESTYTTSAVSSSSLTCSSQSTSPVTTSSYEQTSVLSRIVYESSMAPSEPTSVAVTNGHSSVRTQATLDTTSSVPVLKTEPSPSLPSAGSLPSMVSTTASLLPSASQHAGALPSLPQSNDLASSSLSQLSSSLSNHQSSLSPASVLSSSTSHVDYYGITFPAPATLTGRDGSLANNPFSGDVTKFGRGDSASPAPTTTLAQSQQNQTQTHHTTQQPFLNPTLPPGYSYTGLPYYAGVPSVPSAFQYGPTMFVPPASAKQHGVNLNTTSTPFQQGSGYGQHGYGAGYDDLTQGTAAGDYSKGGYSGSSQAQNKSAGTGPGKGVSVTSSNTGVPDISGSVYNKTQTFDKQGFHAGTPPSFSLPSVLGSTGLNPGAAPGYAPAPFLHILPAHQQPHSQMLHHHLQQDGQGGSGQRNQPSTMQQKSQATKTYGTSPYWTN